MSLVRAIVYPISVAIFVIDQGGVLADGDTNSDILVLISLGVKQ